MTELVAGQAMPGVRPGPVEPWACLPATTAWSCWAIRCRPPRSFLTERGRDTTGYAMNSIGANGPLYCLRLLPEPTAGRGCRGWVVGCLRTSVRGWERAVRGVAADRRRVRRPALPRRAGRARRGRRVGRGVCRGLRLLPGRSGGPDLQQLGRAGGDGGAHRARPARRRGDPAHPQASLERRP